MTTVLFAEDDQDINEAVTEFLNSKGFYVISVLEGNSAMEKFKQFISDIDIVILDIMIPNKSGLEVLKEIREKSLLPVLMLTALSDETTQMNSFDELADGYLVKPVSMDLLLIRIQALLKRVKVPKENKKQKLWRTDSFTVDFDTWTVEKEGITINSIMPKEMQLLQYMYENRNQILSRRQILDALWGYDICIGERAVDNYVKNIRKKLETQAIITIKGLGYKLEERR